MITRRQFGIATPGLLGGAMAVSGCSLQAGEDEYEAQAAQTWRSDIPSPIEGLARNLELVRNATLAPSSHNTQCWKFRLEGPAITIRPDFSRQCPAVDPDDHHLYISLGCATENLLHAALAHGLHGDAKYDASQDAIRVALSPAQAQASALFHAIPLRQCTRGDYDGKALSTVELGLLERAGTSNGVRMLMLTERPAMDHVLDQIVQANTVQMADPAFIKELKAWIRFNPSEAVRTQDGLFSLTTGNAAIPTWLGQRAFGMFFKPQNENDKIAQQIRSSAGIAIFTGQLADKAHWVEVGQCYERFALQATALGIRNALLNQPVEVPSARTSFAEFLGLRDQRPDLVVRFGRGPRMPSSLRRPVQAVLV